MQHPDHLQHQELVKIGIDQAADDRVQLPAVIVDALGDVDIRHGKRCPSPSAGEADPGLSSRVRAQSQADILSLPRRCLLTVATLDRIMGIPMNPGAAPPAYLSPSGEPSRLTRG